MGQLAPSCGLCRAEVGTLSGCQSFLHWAGPLPASQHGFSLGFEGSNSESDALVVKEKPQAHVALRPEGVATCHSPLMPLGC